MRYSVISNSLFKKNRSKLGKLLSANSIAIVHSNDLMPRNGDLFFPYRQSSDFFYLTGIEQEKSIFVLYPDSKEEEYKEALFIIRPNPEMEIWQGKKLTLEQAKKISGIDNVYYVDEYDKIIKHLAIHADSIYLNKNENDRFSSPILSRDERHGKKFQERYSLFKYNRLAPLLESIRIIKEPEEIELMKKACEVTNKAFNAVLDEVKPGMYEYEIEAILSYHFTKNGANGHAYEPIVAAGKNACYLHYTKNSDILKNGDLLFMDFGAEYANYSSDCSRAIPINGKFSARQKEVYSSVLYILKQAKLMLVEGTTIIEYQKEVCEIVEQELIKLKLLSKFDIENQNPQIPAYKKYFMHGTSHFMGLDTHDVGSKEMKLKAGMVFSCEPGIYIPEEGIGIRLENDILVTNSSPIDLMNDIIIEIDEIEDKLNR